jgi:hypothetical protein
MGRRTRYQCRQPPLLSPVDCQDGPEQGYEGGYCPSHCISTLSSSVRPRGQEARKPQPLSFVQMPYDTLETNGGATSKASTGSGSFPPSHPQAPVGLYFRMHFPYCVFLAVHVFASLLDLALPVLDLSRL